MKGAGDVIDLVCYHVHHVLYIDINKASVGYVVILRFSLVKLFVHVVTLTKPLRCLQSSKCIDLEPGPLVVL